MQKRLISYALLAASAASAAIVNDVRQAIAQNDFSLGEQRVNAYKAQNGTTPEMLEALSWLGRGALAAKQYDKAEQYARETQKLCLEQLKKQPLDQERHLPIALGAAIEVQGQAMAARNERTAAVDFLNRELKTYYKTSIRTRIQKNINVLTLAGKKAPAIEVKEYVGPKPPALAELKGKPVLMFFWAHWCGDCKREVPVLAQVKATYGDRLALLGPTQYYGYVEGGKDADEATEKQYIDAVRQKYYSRVADMPVPVSVETFKNYGASTTPTIVLTDATGVVRVYHPGNMTFEELKAEIDKVVN